MQKIAINGFGRIGRTALKVILNKKNLQIVAVNDLGDIENLAYLFKYDSVYGRFKQPVVVSGKTMKIAGRNVPFYSIADPAKLPWKKLKVDTVLECTGVFTKKEDAAKHLRAGAKRVVISAPSKSADIVTVVKGVNQQKAKGQKIIANASCTTNCCAPVMAVLQQAFGVEKAMLTTVHAATASQRVVDLPDAKDWRRGRAAFANLIPSTTGAALATTLVIPELTQKFAGVAVRVPTLCGSLVDITAVLKKNVTVEQLKKVFLNAAKSKQWRGILDASTAELVSQDIVGTTASAIVDLPYLRVVDGNLVKVLAWYDNEWAYSERLVEMVEVL